MTKQPIDESHSSSKRIKKNQIGDTEKSSETADHLASFVATVLRDRSTHDLVKEIKELRGLKKKLENQLLVQITVDKIIGDPLTGEKTTEVVAETSMDEGYFFEDRLGEKLFFVDIPPIRDENGKRNFLSGVYHEYRDWEFSVWLGGVRIFENYKGLDNVEDGVESLDHDDAFEHGFLYMFGSCVEVAPVSLRYEGGERANMNLLGLGFIPSLIPGILALLDQKVLADVRHSVKWTVDDAGQFLEYGSDANHSRPWPPQHPYWG